ncbi:MAG TPA: response regulator, partial [Alphaproteobacteria bacterium]|nr:response regulator [Alphaproteobacteria bacterium]
MFVLLVEDDPLIQGVLADCLQEAGFDTETARTAEEALEIVEHKKDELRLLITDIRIDSADGKTGWDVAQYARQISPELPSIHMSGDSAFERQSNALPDSIFMMKPFRIATLLDLLAKVIS